ncbi:hypothetical protein [Tessaracoccus aquimaris]|nr:hypothetical protein [Tessaracoccus aquimaris]
MLDGLFGLLECLGVIDVEDAERVVVRLFGSVAGTSHEVLAVWLGVA